MSTPAKDVCRKQEKKSKKQYVKIALFKVDFLERMVVLGLMLLTVSPQGSRREALLFASGCLNDNN